MSSLSPEVFLKYQIYLPSDQFPEWLTKWFPRYQHISSKLIESGTCEGNNLPCSEIHGKVIVIGGPWDHSYLSDTINCFRLSCADCLISRSLPTT